MRFVVLNFFLVLVPLAALNGAPVEDANKALALRFYQEVWFTNHTQVATELVAPTYLIHDTPPRENGTEAASMQKEIPDFFWQHGEMSGKIDYQIAEGDLVMTRWFWHWKPTTWWIRLLTVNGSADIPIINVLRFKDGKIVEIWNHRHDATAASQMGVNRLQFFGGVLCGLLGAWLYSFTRRRMLRKSQVAV